MFCVINLRTRAEKRPWRRWTRLCRAIVACALGLAASEAGRGAAETPAPAFASQVDALFAGSVRTNTPGAVVLVARNGKILFEKECGLAQVEAGIPIKRATRFRIGSITKQFTAAAILKLQEQGRLSVNDPISKYIPDWPGGGQVTLRHLLTHSSGIHNYTANPAFQANVTVATPLDALVASFKSNPRDFDPGDKFLYCNSGYTLLGFVIQKVTGVPYGECLQKTLFEPLGMRDTGAYPPRETSRNEAFGYSYQNGTVRRSVNWEMSNVAAAGNLYSTARDLFLWNEALFAGNVLSEISTRAAFTVGFLSGDDPTHPEDTGYGYGWIIDRLNGAREISHGGELAGFGSYLLRLPEYKLTVVVLLNCVPHLPGLQQWSLAREIARLALGPELPSRAGDVALTDLPSGALEVITGRYDMGNGLILAVTREGRRVFMEIAGRKKFEILPRTDRIFFVEGGGAEATFVRNAEGRVFKAILKQGGERIDAPKLED